ncbi:sensor histidine kinase [Conexibacter sp. JD483]|uniref:sensor histidine kinase n=1 Tax=unclassified Conexibacter TaxID=2627773 RepID=UPI0027256F08|nr:MULTISPECIES: sensor histidine kinase [unclassified Conexibacter]MDO8187382.1 sensor histidine kinase [Conexibacter sp. CPCC 205706]MDO8200977.1 sensor histidine kinase [Conexibacter sp. CPCC 205762]MDR9371401.1 sensor histidine kinase [Conexibacter sp. JD483]
MQAETRRLTPPARADVLAAIVCAVVCVGLGKWVERTSTSTSTTPPRSVDLLGIAVIAIACTPVAFRRVDRRGAAIAALLLSALGATLNYPMTGPLLVALGLVGAATSRAEMRLTGTLGVFSGLVFAFCALLDTHGQWVVVLIGAFAVGMLPALVGEKLRAYRISARDANELARKVEELRDRDVERAVAEERLRIARDVHDITGHHLSAISLQAAGAGRTTPDPVAKAAFERIHGLTTEALGQTRRALGVLRESGPATLSPAPRLEHVELLLTPAREAGLDVDLRLRGEERSLPDDVETCAYRIVQESLTNVVRHAHASEVVVRVDFGDDELFVAVDDDGVGGQPGRHGGGLAGMRERVALVGGELEAGPVGRRGWSVRATLPLGGAGARPAGTRPTGARA